MKYQDAQTVSSVYSEGRSCGLTPNPFLEAMPEPLERDAFFARMQSRPPLPYGLVDMDAAARRAQLVSLQAFFYPMDYMYVIYDSLYRAIATAYTTKTTLDSIRQLNAVHMDFRVGEGYRETYAVQPDSSSILGAPGIGKTSAVRRCLGLLPQVIVHTEYNGKPFYTKQITHLAVECPSDCSVKTLAFSIAAAVDRAIGSEYFERMSRVKSLSASALATQIKIICLNHHVGVIVVDEIQNAVATAQKNRQVKPLIRFLVELTNDTSTGACFVGTPEAEELFCSQEHLKRRTRGLRLLPLKPGTVFRNFLETLWAYQFTTHKTELTDKLANQLYDRSAGIPAYLVKLFCEAQSQAILTGRERLDGDMLKQAAERLAIQIPKVFAKGTYISDFTVCQANTGVQERDMPTGGAESFSEGDCVPRQYAVPRGRRKAVRERTDLIELLKRAKTAEGMCHAIERLGLREENA